MLALCLFAQGGFTFAGLLLLIRRALLVRGSLGRGFSRPFGLLYEQHESLDVYLNHGFKNGALLLNEYGCLLLWWGLLNALLNALLVAWKVLLDALKDLRRDLRTVPSESKFSLRMARASLIDIILSLGFFRLEPLRLFCRACLR